MESVYKLEEKLAIWYKSVPHLPTKVQKWIIVNVWWIVLIGVILSAIGIISILGSIGVAVSLMATTSDLTRTYYNSANYSTGWIVGAFISLLFVIASTLILAWSIQPLKAQRRRGWLLLFIAWIINAASIVVDAIATFSVFGFIGNIIFGAIGLAISAYFLYEIRSGFALDQASKVNAPTKSKVTKNK